MEQEKSSIQGRVSSERKDLIDALNVFFKSIRELSKQLTRVRDIEHGKRSESESTSE